mgnify:CR=1 FL=1
MSSSLRRLTRCAVLTALALALSVAEGLVPLTILFPLPGLRLGLANLVTVYALCRLSGRLLYRLLIPVHSTTPAPCPARTPPVNRKSQHESVKLLWR